MFESLVRDVAAQLGIGGSQAQSLLGSLLNLIFDRNGGGFAGFLSKFENAGLGNLAKSWLGGGSTQSILPDQVSQVLGSGAIGNVASKLGLPVTAVSSGFAAMLPKVMAGLTPGGKLPSAIPSALSGLLGHAGAAAGAAGAATAAAGSTAWSAANRAAGGAAAVAEEGARSAYGFLKWLIPLLIILALIWWFVARTSHHPETATVGEATTSAVANAGNAVANTAAAAAGAVATASSAAMNALSALVPGKFTAADLVKALNLMAVHFDTGKATISADSDPVLQKAASLIKAAPAGTQIEIGGHTDATGDAAANLTLSQQRAESVRDYLVQLGVPAGMLTAKGYGEATAADGDSNAAERRVSFTVLN